MLSEYKAILTEFWTKSTEYKLTAKKATRMQRFKEVYL